VADNLKEGFEILNCLREERELFRRGGGEGGGGPLFGGRFFIGDGESFRKNSMQRRTT